MTEFNTTELPSGTRTVCVVAPDQVDNLMYVVWFNNGVATCEAKYYGGIKSGYQS